MNRTGTDAPGRPALPAVIASQVDQLRCGSILLTVPLLHGVVQVGSNGPLPTTKIEVRKSLSTVTVRRTDGTALQAQIIRRTDDGPVSRADVFTEPVPALTIRREIQLDRTHVWRVDSDIRPHQCADLFQLITTIATFGVAKQGTNPGRERLPASA